MRLRIDSAFSFEDLSFQIEHLHIPFTQRLNYATISANASAPVVPFKAAMALPTWSWFFRW